MVENFLPSSEEEHLVMGRTLNTEMGMYVILKTNSPLKSSLDLHRASSKVVLISSLVSKMNVYLFFSTSSS